jgi:TrmH family RNA methyltransferase
MPVVLTKADLQRLRSLREKKHREALGVFVVEGEKVVGELLAAGFEFAEIYATAAWRPPPKAVGGVPPPREDRAERGVRAPRPPPKAIRISEEEMSRASHFPTPSSVLALGRIAPTPLVASDLARGLTLALDGVQDAGNVGTLLRIADWFGLARVLLSADGADLFHQKVINASMGSFARVAAHRVELAAVLNDVPPGTPILGCDLDGEDVHALPSIEHAIIVIGSEGRGLSADVAKHVTRRITIPRFGGAESLNAAVAAAIVCDNLRRRR